MATSPEFGPLSREFVCEADELEAAEENVTLELSDSEAGRSGLRQLTLFFAAEHVSK